MAETVWISKHALTGGLMEFPIERIDGEMCVVRDRKWFGGVRYFHGKDWHRTRGAAEMRAEEMRIAKIASLRKQIEKLTKLTFEERQRDEATSAA